ncbi:MAG: Ca-activated chloride channel [Cryptosporangiaceae bacterium]|nr:Ca-activated chloride channel [Cryptosporangiaceae bacterium]
MTRHLGLLHPDEIAPDDSGQASGVGALHTGRGNLPLEELSVRASVTGLTSSTELTQVFRNVHSEPLEATYVFPLPSRSAVTGMRMEAGGRTVEAVLKERGAARTAYDDALRAGQRASIAEEERPGVFTMRVGNIVPGERVTVRLQLAGQLSYEDGSATYVFPLVVAPRYIPGPPLPSEPVGDGTALDTTDVPDASRITPPVLLRGFPQAVALSIEATIDPAGLPLAAVRSSLHAVTVDGSERADGDPAPGPVHSRVRVRIQPGERVDRDFVLRLDMQPGDAVGTSLAVAPDGTFALTLLPPAGAAPARPRDVVLVLDRSGSMEGWKIVAARRAAAAIAGTLTTADRIAVLAFDHAVERPPGLGDGVVAATDRVRAAASAYLRELPARGGTEMLDPLVTAAGLLGDPERDRVLVLITDGQVGNEDQVLREILPRLDGVRCYTIGIDSAVNEGFLRRLAIATGGRCELAESADRLDEAIDGVHRRIAGPLVTDLALTAGGLTDLTPARLPSLFPGAAAVIAGRLAPGTGAITVSGRAAGGGAWSETVTATPSSDSGIVACWARGRVRDLEDEYVIAEAGDRGRLSELEAKLLNVSLEHGVLCRFTAFVAVDERVVTDGGSHRRVTQPVELPQGWQFAPPPSAVAGSGGGGGGFMATRSLSGMGRPSFMPASAPPVPEQLDTTFGAAAPASPAPAPASPAPVAPTPGSLTPGSLTPGSLTPGSLTPGSLTAGSGHPGGPLARLKRSARGGSPGPGRRTDQPRPLGGGSSPANAVGALAERFLRRMRAAAGASLADRRAVLHELAEATAQLAATPDGWALQRLARELAQLPAAPAEFERRWLLVLDSLEGVLDPAAAGPPSPFWRR